MNAKARLDWLDRQDPTRWGADFWPQPYEQLAKVFREMGHGDEAVKVLVEKERRQRGARRRRERNDVARALLCSRDAVLGATVAYGRRPLRAFAWLVGVWLFGTGVFWQAYEQGAMRPAILSVLESSEWRACIELRSGGDPKIGACYFEKDKGEHYPRFQPLVYSAETLLPVVNLEQRAFWTPDPVPVGGRGWWTRTYLWAHTLMGWALGLLAIAGFSGLVKSD